MTEELPQVGYGLRSFTKREIFEVVVIEGEGVKNNPDSAVTYWILEDGTQLLRRDPITFLTEERGE